MRKLGIVGVLLLCLIMVSATACNPLGGEKEATEQLVEVVRDDLAATVSGSGNIEVSNEMKLTFGVAGRVDKIYVEEGDEVREGDVLAKLETDALELRVAEAQVAVTQAQVAVAQAEVAVTQAEVAVTQAQMAWQTAELELDRATNVYKWPELEVAYADVERAKLSVENTQDRLASAIENDPEGDHSSLVTLIARALANLVTYENKLNAMLSGADKEEVAIKKLQVQAAEQSLELIEQSLELAGQSLELAQQSPELAQQSLEQAQKQLNDTTITAPFDGKVAEVYVDEKDTVSTVTPIIHLIDTITMELNVEVDEIDVAEVKPGQRAIIEVDALPALPLEGKVSSISLLPTQVSGVVVYAVKIEFNVPEGTGLRIGMSATADIIIAERSNVLLVPDRAIKQDSEGNTIVEVMVNEQIEERIVVTGISDGFQTEIVDGLEEGEMVKRK